MPGEGMSLDDFDVQGVMAKGSFGSVFKAVRKSDGRLFALKQVNLSGMKRVDREEAIDEARMLSQFNHAHITKHYGSFIDKENKLNIVMEYAANGSLHAVIRAAGTKGLPEDRIWKCFIQSLVGLSYIHSRKIIHRDIKSLNLFLDANGNIKIGDLGIARALSAHSDFAHTILGTPYYLSPELCDDRPYNEKSDVWALGVVLYECCMGRYPFEAQNEGALIRKILKGTFTPVQGPYSPALVQMVSLLLSFEPAKRPDTQQLLRMPTVLAKAKALNIDLSGKPTAEPDAPAYAQAAPAARGPAAPSSSDMGHPFHQAAGPAAAAGPWQGQQWQGQQWQEQQGGQGRPQYGGAAAGGPAGGAGRHPFELDPRDAPHAQQAQQWQQQQQRQPQQQQQQAAMPRAKQDHMGDMLRDNSRGMVSTAGQQGRLLPQDMPTAGARPSRPGAGPGFFGYADPPANATLTSQGLASASIWTVRHEAPQYGRKKHPDLMVTGPTLRGASAGGGGAGGGGGGRAADDATSYCSTSYVPTATYR